MHSAVHSEHRPQVCDGRPPGFGLWARLPVPMRALWAHRAPLVGEVRLWRASHTPMPRSLGAGHTPPSADVLVLMNGCGVYLEVWWWDPGGLDAGGDGRGGSNRGLPLTSYPPPRPALCHPHSPTVTSIIDTFGERKWRTSRPLFQSQGPIPAGEQAHCGAFCSSGGGLEGFRTKTHWVVCLLDKIMILQGVRPTIQRLGVGYANRPKKRDYVVFSHICGPAWFWYNKLCKVM